MKPLPAHTIFALPSGHATIHWRRNPRARRVSLRIDASRGAVVVTLPARAAQAAGMALLTRNAGWVAARLAALPEPTNFQPGVEITIDGIPHPIRHVPACHGGAWLDDGHLLVSGAPEFIARRVADFLRAEARRRLSAQAIAKAQFADLQVKRITVKDTRTRWGSCTPDGCLMFCWRLLMAPPFVQDYVVSHEVAHLRHMNHGSAFWALTDTLSPHRKRAVAWLHREGPGLLRAG